MIKLLLRLLLVQLVFSVVLMIQGYWYWLLNFELAFIASTLVVLGSFSGYKRMVQNRIEAGEGLDDDMLEKLEDPYALYEEESPDKGDEQDLAALVKEEKLRLKENRQTIKKTVKSVPGIFSMWRFLPYLFLVLSFIGLNNNHLLDIPAFLLGLGAGIVSAILIGKRWIAALSR